VSDVLERPSVDDLVARLHAEQQRHAEAQERARQAADALISDPSRNSLEMRDRLAGAVELAELRISKLRRELEQAKERERAGQRDVLVERRADRSTRTREALAKLERGQALIDEAVDALGAVKREIRTSNGQLSALGHASAAGEQLNVPGPLQHSARRWIEALGPRWSKLCHPMMW
jgi:hypothetical protein